MHHDQWPSTLLPSKSVSGRSLLICHSVHTQTKTTYLCCLRVSQWNTHIIFYPNEQLKEEIGQQRRKCSKEMESRNIGSKLWVEWNGVMEEIADRGYADTITTWKCYMCSPRNLTKEPHRHKWEKVVEMKRMKRWYQQKLLIKGTLGDNSQHGKHKR